MEDRRKPDVAAKATHWMTLIGVPVIIMFLGWAAMQFDGMRFAVASLQQDMTEVKATVTAHTGQLNTIWNKLIGQ